MQQYSVIVTAHAENQIREIRNYISLVLGNPTAAKNLLVLIRKQIKSLEFMPYRFQCIDESVWQGNEIRRIIARNFYIFYWIDEQKDTVQVISIAYVRRNQRDVIEEAED